jgi:hypothetical protein
LDVTSRNHAVSGTIQLGSGFDSCIRGAIGLIGIIYYLFAERQIVSGLTAGTLKG